MFKKIYENEFGTPGGEPYGALIGDYEFTNHPEDIELLAKMSNVAAGGVPPVHLGRQPEAVRLRRAGRELSKPRDLEKIFDTVEYTKWRVFRDTRRLALRHPGHAARPGAAALRRGHQADRGVRLRGGAGGRPGKAKPMDHEQYCWMNAAYVMGTRLTDAFAKYGFCTAIRGAEGGGKVEGLPAHIFTSDDGDPDLKCPTEIGITDRREAELYKLGFLPLCHYKNTDYAVFFGAQTTQKPKKYDRPEATANAAISARLPYIMATAAFAHYLKVMARDKIGSFMEASDCEDWLNRWIKNYVNANENAGPEIKAKYPAARGQGRRSRRSRASRARTTPSPICGRGCRWRN